jgi:hypothetical protein
VDPSPSCAAGLCSLEARGLSSGRRRLLPWHVKACGLEPGAHVLRDAP